MQAPTATIGLSHLYAGDAVQFLREYDGRQVDQTLTSPPYNLGKAYEGMPDDLAWADYLDWVELWAAHLYDVTVDHGRLVLNVPLDRNLGGEHVPFASEVLASLQAAGWRFETHVVWDKVVTNGSTAYGSWLSASAPNVVMPVEVLLVMSKGTWKRGIHGRATDITAEQFMGWRNTVWRFPGASAAKAKHPAPFPEELARRALRLFGFRQDLVLDPFVGSGTTCAVAEELGRASIGVDQSAEYLEQLAAPRIEAARDRRLGGLTDSQGQRWENLPLEATTAS
jgi:site-specific DNA-methyltransferase (adenine-specific)